MININNISFSYDKSKNIIDNLSLNILPKEITVIIGKNGSGKSTLANLIANINKVSQGKITIDDILYNKKNKFLIRKKIGIVFQDPNNQIIFNRTYDDIKFTLENYNVPKDEIDQRIKEALISVEMLEYINENPYKLSIGQKQRIVLASVLAINPDYIIFDESTAFLDPEGKDLFYKIIRKLIKQGKGIIFITNNLNEIIVANKIVLLNNNHIEKIISDKDLVNNFQTFENIGFKIPLTLKLIKQLNLDITRIDNIEDKIMEVINEK